MPRYEIRHIRPTGGTAFCLTRDGIAIEFFPTRTDATLYLQRLDASAARPEVSPFEWGQMTPADRAAYHAAFSPDPAVRRLICEVCGADIRKDRGRCTNVRCAACHAKYCTGGGDTSPGHNRLWPAREG